MGIEKSELKRALLGDLKREAVERRDALQAEAYRIEGGITALTNLVKSIERDVFARLKRDIEEGKIDPETEAKQVDRYIQTCMNFAKHLGKQLSERLPLQKGQVLEATAVIKMLANSAGAEEKKIEATKAAMEAGEAHETEDGIEQVPSDEKGPSRRPVGVRPASSLKARRSASEGSEDDLDLRGGSAFKKPSEAPPATAQAPPTKKKRTAKGKRGGKNTG